MAKKKKTFAEITRKRVERLAKHAPIRLRIAREASGKTRADMARELRMTRGRWSQYEKGQRLLNWEVACHIAMICEVDANYILIGFDEHLEPNVKGRIRMIEDKLRLEGVRAVIDGQHRVWSSRRG
jgi:transcriptional regulator with XRE-family HTH domain